MYQAVKNDKHGILAVLHVEKPTQGDEVKLVDKKTTRHIERIVHHDRKTTETTVLLRPPAKWLLGYDQTAWSMGTPKELCEIFPPFRNISDWTGDNVRQNMADNMNTSIVVNELHVRYIDASFDQLLHLKEPVGDQADWTLVVAFYPTRERDGF